MKRLSNKQIAIILFSGFLIALVVYFNILVLFLGYTW
jgi:hypothetical protein